MKEKAELAKFTREWKGKVLVGKQTMGDDSVHYIAHYKHPKVGEWIPLETQDMQTGKLVTARFETAVGAMEAAQREWTAKKKAQIIMTEAVFP